MNSKLCLINIYNKEIIDYYLKKYRKQVLLYLKDEETLFLLNYNLTKIQNNIYFCFDTKKYFYLICDYTSNPMPKKYKKIYEKFYMELTSYINYYLNYQLFITEKEDRTINFIIDKYIDNINFSFSFMLVQKNSSSSFLSIK
jgi:hypothetical protein